MKLLRLNTFKDGALLSTQVIPPGSSCSRCWQRHIPHKHSTTSSWHGHKSACSQTVACSIQLTQLLIQSLPQTPAALNMKEWVKFLPLIKSLTMQVRFRNMSPYNRKWYLLTVQRRGLLDTVKLIISCIMNSKVHKSFIVTLYDLPECY
jgi:hypothetical protein